MKGNGNGSQGQKSKTTDEICIDMENPKTETGSDSQERRENNNDSSPEASIKMKLGGLPSVYPQCCIYRVPERLRKKFEEEYTPRVVSIGPYHHKATKSLTAMEDQKLRYVQNFLNHNKRRSPQEYLEAIEKCEDEIRQCYDEHIDMKQNAFKKMIFVDSIFIIQLFLLNRFPTWREPTDPVFNKPWMHSDVLRDLELLENQLPFFVIENLYTLAFGFHQKSSLIELAYQFFRPGREIVANLETVNHAGVQHFLDIIRLSHLPKGRKAPNQDQADVVFIPSATKLVAAGVNLKKSKRKCIFDITFEKGVLEIPRLQLYSTSESYFKNMIAFEQVYYRNDSYLIDYFYFFDHLVNTAADAGLLIEEGIIESWLGNHEEVANLLNRYCKDAPRYTNNTHFLDLRKDLSDHYDKRWNRWKTSLKRDYFTSPWAAISLFAAIILLILTVIQTACSIIQTK